MSDTCWYRLYNELNLTLEIINEDDLMVSTIEGPLPLNRYHSFVMDLVSQFIGECRKKIEDSGKVPDEFSDLRMKLNYYFKANFGVEYIKDSIQYPLIYREKIPVTKACNRDPFVTILLARVEACALAVDSLELNLSGEEKNSHQLPLDSPQIKYNSSYLPLGYLLHPAFKKGENYNSIIELLYNSLRTENLIKEGFSHEFSRLFNGILPARKIIWNSKLSYLKYFINQLLRMGIIEDPKRKLFSIAENSFCLDSGKNIESGSLSSRKIPSENYIIDTIILELLREIS